MKTLVISDVHANLEALEAVLRTVQRKGVARIISLGDVVGYGANPNQVLDALQRQRRTKIYVRGNHDRVASGAGEPDEFNHAARQAILWSREKLSRDGRNRLRDFVIGPVDLGDGTLLCHGTPDDEDEYLLSEVQAMRIFSAYPHKLVLFGHTHLPSIFRLDQHGNISGDLAEAGMTLRMEPGIRYLVNPGSVGQPRDRDTRAAFGLWDSKRSTFRFMRADYDVAAAIEAICCAGLPEILGRRLRSGF